MRVSGVELVDANVWLALVFGDHQRHEPARLWFDAGQGRQFAFCRITQMAFLRHLTNPSILGHRALSRRKAWDAYDQIRRDDRITFLSEPQGTEAVWRGLTSADQSGHRLWTDAYLAAFAIAAGIPVVTCDRDFQKFPGLVLKSL